MKTPDMVGWATTSGALTWSVAGVLLHAGSRAVDLGLRDRSQGVARLEESCGLRLRIIQVHSLEELAVRIVRHRSHEVEPAHLLAGELTRALVEEEVDAQIGDR